MNQIVTLLPSLRIGGLAESVSELMYIVVEAIIISRQVIQKP